MFDLATEASINLNVAAEIASKASGKATHISTVLRWITRGIKTNTGDVVRLEGMRLGGRWLTSREALQRFAESLTPQFEPAKITKPSRKRASSKAAAELERMGV